MLRSSCWLMMAVGALGLCLAGAPGTPDAARAAPGDQVWGGGCQGATTLVGGACTTSGANSCTGFLCIGTCPFACSPVNTLVNGNAIFTDVGPGAPCPPAIWMSSCTWGYIWGVGWTCICMSPVATPCFATPQVSVGPCLIARRDGSAPPLTLAKAL